MKGIAIIGGPGSGKSTQCKMGVQSFPFAHYCVGEYLREEATKDSEISNIIQDAWNEGKLIPSNITVSVLKRELCKNTDTSIIRLLDGFPRSIDNFNEWQKQWSDFLEIERMIYFHVPDEVMVERIASRSTKEDRKFDTEEIWRKRIQGFYDNTEKVIQLFEEKDMLTVIDGNRSLEEVYSDFCQALKCELDI